MHPQNMLLEVAFLVELHGAANDWTHVGSLTCVHAQVTVHLVNRGHDLVAEWNRRLFTTSFVQQGVDVVDSS